MANIIQATQFNHCYGCLAKTDKVNLEIYHLQAVSLQTIFQAKQMTLCYICIKLAKNTERFIHNVQTAQNLLKGITDITNENNKPAMKPLKLTVFLPDPNDVLHAKELDDDDDEKIKLEYEDDFPDTDLDTDYIKQEQSDIEDILPAEDNVESFINCSEDEYDVKDDTCLKFSKFKENEVEDEKKYSKRRKKNVESEKITKESKLAGKVETQIETLYLTDQQCLEERAQKISDKLYNSCEFKCVDCIKGFSYRPSYDKHMEKHSKLSGDYECDICKQRVVSEEKLNIHKRIHKVRYKCAICNLTRVCSSSIADHISTVHGAGATYGCTKCEKTFKCKASLRKHIHYSHKEKIPCKFCNKQLATKQSLKVHLLRRHPSEVSTSTPAKKCVCKVCGMAFESPSRLKVHLTKHSLRRDFYCVECDKSFKTYTSLQQHLKTVSVHVTNEDVKFPCPKCKKRFTTKAHLERHVNYIHKKARFYCDQCGKEYGCKYKLVYHLREHEGYEKPRKFLCHVCKKGFRSKSGLDTHLRIHTGEKPFQCPECPAQFNQYGSLYNHKKLVHKIIGTTKKEASNDEQSKT